MSEVKANSVVGLTKPLPDNLLPVTASAWVNFDGTGSVAIRGSRNVSSITDNGVGAYVVNFSVPLEDANYSPAVSSGANGVSVGPTTIATTGFGVTTINSSGTPQDTSLISAHAFGGQS